MMTRHNLKLAWRNLMKYKLQNTINILALAAGMAAMALALCVTDRMKMPSYMKQPHIDRWYNVQLQKLNNEEDRTEWYQSDPTTFSLLTANGGIACTEYVGCRSAMSYNWEYWLNEGDSVGRMLKTNSIAIMSDDLRLDGFRSARTGEVLPTLKRGDAVICKAFAKRIFGDKNPIGQQVNTNRGSFIIRDIYEPVSLASRWKSPSNTSEFIFCVAPSDTVLQTGELKDLYNSGYNIILKEGADIADFEREANSRLAPVGAKVECQQMNKLAIANTFILNLRKLILAIGWLILLSTGIGFLKLQLQMMGMRRREAALRTVHGAKMRHLFATFFADVLLQGGMAVTLALFLITWLIRTAETHLQGVIESGGWEFSAAYSYFAMIAGTMAVVSAVAVWLGLRTMLRQGQSMASRLHRGGSAGLRNIMLSVQLTIGILFIGCTCSLVLYASQVMKTFVRPQDKEKMEHALLVDVRDYYEDVNRLIRELPDAEEVHDIRLWDRAVSVAVSFEKNDPNEILCVYKFWETFQYDIRDTLLLKTLGVGVRWLVPEEKRTSCMLVSQYVYDVMKEHNFAPNNVINADPSRNTYVIGGIFEPLPYTMNARPHKTTGFIYITDLILPEHSIIVVPKKGRHDQLKLALENEVAQKAKKDAIKFPIRKLKDVLMNQNTVLVENMVRGAWVLCGLCLVVCIMGIWSSISLDTRSRRKEIALRKVHGAKRWDITLLLGRLYGVLLVVATTVSVPFIIQFNDAVTNWFKKNYGSYSAMECNAMQSYTVPGLDVTFSPTLPILAGVLVTTLCVLIVVGYHIRKANNINPASVIGSD